MRLNEEGEALIKGFESFSAVPYLCPAGIWTIGWGHTHGVTESTPTITKEIADQLFDQDAAIFVGMVSQLVEVPLNDNQFSALVSLCFNEGSAPLHKTLGAKLNSGDFEGASREFHKWIYAGGIKLDGLIRRREAERALFEKPVTL